MRDKLLKILTDYRQMSAEGYVVEEHWFNDIVIDIETLYSQKVVIISPHGFGGILSVKAIDGLNAKGAIIEASAFCKLHGLSECELFHHGFLFDIEPDLTEQQIAEKVSEYNRNPLSQQHA